jgi:hypothetical protein
MLWLLSPITYHLSLSPITTYHLSIPPIHLSLPPPSTSTLSPILHLSPITYPPIHLSPILVTYHLSMGGSPTNLSISSPITTDPITYQYHPITYHLLPITYTYCLLPVTYYSIIRFYCKVFLKYENQNNRHNRPECC